MSKEKKEKKGNGGAGKFFVCLISAIVIFIVMLVVKSNVEEKNEKVNVIVAKQDILADTDITVANVNDLFMADERIKNTLPANAFIVEVDENGKLTDWTSKVVDSIMSQAISAKQIVTTNDVTSFDDVTAKIKEEVGSDELGEISFSISNIDRAVAGTVRRGDIVTISLYHAFNDDEDINGTDAKFDPETLTVSNPNSSVRPVETLIIENVHIKQAYNSNGDVIPTDSTETATLFTIISSKECIDKINAFMMQENVRVSLTKTNDVKY